MIEDMVARLLQPGTQRGYVRGCLKFAAFLKRSPETATADDVRAFQLHLAESDISICSRNQHMVGVGFLLRVTMKRPDLAEGIYYLREPKKIPKVMSQSEVKRLIAMARGLQAQVTLSLAYGCGLRAGEVVRLKTGDIDRDQKIIRVVQSKGRKDRHVMLSPTLLDLLQTWWGERTNRYDLGVPRSELWLFPGRRPSPSKGGLHLTTRQLSRLFHEAADAAGIKTGVSLHTLRHSFATHLLERKIDIRLIQAMLGHDKLDTTAHYTRVATGMIAGVTSPLDDLGLTARSLVIKRKRRAKDTPSE
jgi:site-specific recombinase XerD